MDGNAPYEIISGLTVVFILNKKPLRYALAIPATHIDSFLAFMLGTFGKSEVYNYEGERNEMLIANGHMCSASSIEIDLSQGEITVYLTQVSERIVK